MKVAGVVLAAGRSARLGQSKQLVYLGQERLLERAVRVAREAGLAPIVVVLGCRAQEIQRRCGLVDVLVVVNEGWTEGMGSSIRAGISALGAETEGAVLLTCDQPAVDSAHLRKLIEAALTESGGAQPIGSSYAGKVGVPAFIPASRFGELLVLRGGEGARKLLGMANAIVLSGGELDVDTAEALELARLRFS